MLENITAPKNKAIYCKVAQVLETLDKKDQEILNSWLEDEAVWSANGISKTLRAHTPISLADTTITKHRKRICACYR